jgi:hypothetical protein
VPSSTAAIVDPAARTLLVLADDTLYVPRLAVPQPRRIDMASTTPTVETSALPLAWGERRVSALTLMQQLPGGRPRRRTVWTFSTSSGEDLELNSEVVELGLDTSTETFARALAHRLGWPETEQEPRN